MVLTEAADFVEFPNAFNGIVINTGRVAFTVFGIDVFWYGVIITAAIVLGILYGMKSAVRVGIIPDSVFDTAFWGVLGGIVGARTYYVVFSGNVNSLYDAVTGIREGGLAVYGGLIGAIVAGVIAAKLIKVRIPPFMDLLGLGFLIGHCVGRWGNFFNQEAFGAPTAGDLPWGMTGSMIKNAEVVREAQLELGNSGLALVHPCFLYESLWCLIGFLFLHFYLRKLKSFDGEVFLLYVMWYGAGRSVIESLRTDSLIAGGLRVSQVLAIASAIFAAGLFVYFKFTLTKKKGYVMFKDTEGSSRSMEKYAYDVKLTHEKEKAKNRFIKTQRELSDPFAESITEDSDSSGNSESSANSANSDSSEKQGEK